MLKQFWNLLFPQKCAVCGGAAENSPLCPNCGRWRPYHEHSQLALGYKYSALFEYDETAKKIIAQIKYRKNRELIPFVQEAILRHAPKIDADLLIPMPLNPLRRQERGFNQSEEFFKPYAAYQHIPLRGDLVYRGRNTQKLAALSPAERAKETADIFQVWENKRAELKNKKILLVDDIITTGATLKKLAEVVAQYNPASIEILGVFRPKLQADVL
jgi:ComF family protein